MGRPASYDRQQLLDQVLNLFWKHGLTATPVSLLVKSTGIHAASLYSAFGSKQGLMLAALEHYAEQSGNQMQQWLSLGSTTRQRLQTMFDGIVEDSLADDVGRGCFLVNVAMETANAKDCLPVYQKAQQYLADARARIQAVLEQGQQAGEISQSLNCGEAAVFIQGVVYAVRVMARTRASRDMLQTTIDHGLQSIFGKKQALLTEPVHHLTV